MTYELKKSIEDSASAVRTARYAVKDLETRIAANSEALIALDKSILDVQREGERLRMEKVTALAKQCEAENRFSFYTHELVEHPF